jgi:hypothetical protein
MARYSLLTLPTDAPPTPTGTAQIHCKGPSSHSGTQETPACLQWVHQWELPKGALRCDTVDSDMFLCSQGAHSLSCSHLLWCVSWFDTLLAGPGRCIALVSLGSGDHTLVLLLPMFCSADSSVSPWTTHLNLTVLLVKALLDSGCLGRNKLIRQEPCLNPSWTAVTKYFRLHITTEIYCSQFWRLESP